jgi:hypothetical protein
MSILGPNLRRDPGRLERSRLDLHRVEADETLTPLNLLSSRSAERKERVEEMPEPEEGVSDPLIMGLVARLPKPDTVWPLEERAKWLRTAASIFALVYRTGDDEGGERDQSEIGIALGRSGLAKAARPGDFTRSSESSD